MLNLSIHGRVALLIDADNIDLSYLEQILRIAEYYGKLEICRAYRDWDKIKLATRKKIDALQIKRIQVNQIGKNATDHRLLAEVGKILGNDLIGPDINIFIIVSGDGDFASVCELIRENSKQVIGIAKANKTSNDLKQICDSFHHLEELENELIEIKKLYPIPPKELRKFWDYLFSAYHQLTLSVEWVAYDHLEKKLREIHSNFQAEFGKYELAEWLKHFDKDFETNGEMVRRIDPDPEFTRVKLMIKAYLQTRQVDGRADQEQFGKVLRELDSNYESRFGDKKLTEWLADYPQLFTLHETHVIHTYYRPEYASYPNPLYEMQLTISGIVENMLR